MIKKTKQQAFYTVQQYATLKGVNDRTVRRWIESGKIHANKVMTKKGTMYEIPVNENDARVGHGLHPGRPVKSHKPAKEVNV